MIPDRSSRILVIRRENIGELVCTTPLLRAMHLAAALGLPIVCLFGSSAAACWQPWGVPYRLLQKQSFDVRDLSVEEVAEAFTELPLRAVAD